MTSLDIFATTEHVFDQIICCWDHKLKTFLTKNAENMPAIHHRVEGKQSMRMCRSIYSYALILGLKSRYQEVRTLIFAKISAKRQEI